jgi:pimeloyl-ACP methyl ester carboxylesterase
VALERRELEPLARLVRFPTRDDLELAGLLFEPKRTSKRVAIFIHGMGGSFESRRTNILARAFTKRGIAWFAFNNRGSYVIRRGGGMGMEKIRDCVYDLDAAIGELRRRGYRDVTLIGHSTGANKIAVYNAYTRRNLATRYILLGGGDDTGLSFSYLGARRFHSALAKARVMIKAGRGDELAPRAYAPWVTSWRAFHDMSNPDGDYNVFPFLEIMRGIRLSKRSRFRHLRTIRKPTLVLYGDRDEFCFDDVSACVAILADAVGARTNFEIATLADADHGFNGHEEELACVMLDWIGT